MKVTVDKALIEQAIEALANVVVSGPDDDGVIWINLPGNGVTGKAILRVGKSGLIAAQCATLFDEQRVGAIAALREALAEPACATRTAVEPFGYFRAEPFGWTDCAPTDEGAKAFYEAPPPAEPAVEPVAYRYKYLNFMGDEVWSQEMPSNGKVLETQALYASPRPPAEPDHWSDCATNNEPAYPAGACDCMPTPAMCRAAVEYVNGADVYEKVPREALDIEESIYREAWIAMQAVAPPPAEPAQTTCNCRWEGGAQVQWCALHKSHEDAIDEWAERAKTAEKKLAEPAPVPLFSDEEIESVNNVWINRLDYEVFEIHQPSVYEFARAIEQLVRRKAGL